MFNTILDERGLPAQLALFENAARHLAPGGCVVVEAFVLRDDARDGSWTVSPRYVGDDHVELQMVRCDIETSTVERWSSAPLCTCGPGIRRSSPFETPMRVPQSST